MGVSPSAPHTQHVLLPALLLSRAPQSRTPPAYPLLPTAATNVLPLTTGQSPSSPSCPLATIVHPSPAAKGSFEKASWTSPSLLGLCSTLNEVGAPYHISSCSLACPALLASEPPPLLPPALSHSWSSQTPSQPHPQPAHGVLPAAGNTSLGKLLGPCPLTAHIPSCRKLTTATTSTATSWCEPGFLEESSNHGSASGLPPAVYSQHKIFDDHGIQNLPLPLLQPLLLTRKALSSAWAIVTSPISPPTTAPGPQHLPFPMPGPMFPASLSGQGGCCG